MTSQLEALSRTDHGSKRKIEEDDTSSTGEAAHSKRKRPHPLVLSLDTTNLAPRQAQAQPHIDQGPEDLAPSEADTDDTDSLFDEPPIPASPPASRTCPPIPGLYLFPHVLLPSELASHVFHQCLQIFFSGPNAGANQVMLFERPSALNYTSTSRLPSFLQTLLDAVKDTLAPTLEQKTLELLFDEKGGRGRGRARQAIVNLYQPGEGISPHVDLLDRYDDGIVGVSFGSGCIMRFDHPPSQTTQEDSAGITGEEAQKYEVYLPERSVLVLTGDARYEWTHGIEGRERDWVESVKEDADVESVSGEWVERDVRVSVTFRWLLPGADVVGGPDGRAESEEGEKNPITS